MGLECGFWRQRKGSIFIIGLCLILACSLVGCGKKDTGAGTGTAEAADASDAALSFEPFFRIDLDDPEAWKGELSNTRFLTKGKYSFQALDEKYGVDPAFVPDTEGLDTLNISGSAEFSEEQFRKLAEELRALAEGKQIYIVDARQESHALLNGISISWYDLNNWGNKGMGLSEVEAAEAERFGALTGTVVKAYGVSDNEKINSLDIEVSEVMTEKELVESEGFTYLRLPGPDHSWPEEESVDAFIEFVKGIDMEDSWLHFHCQAGKSRTGIFMEIYDMMKNPGVSFEDIVTRHAMTGTSYFPYVNGSSALASVYELRAKRIRQVYEYIQENRDTDYAVRWSDWVEKDDAK